MEGRLRPEGIAVSGQTFYTGSLGNGAIYRGNLRTGQGAVFVAAGPGNAAAVGMKADRRRLFVAGGPTGNGFVYDTRTRALIRSYAFSPSGSFINDVVVTKRAAWFTDSFKPVLYRVPLAKNGQPGLPGSFTTVTLTGDYDHGGGFNLNGIAATRNGKTLVVVQSGTGQLFTVTPGGVTREISLAGNENVMGGDGILLDGKTLFVVQNQMNAVARIALASNLRSGRVVTRIQNSRFDVPTTIAEHGRRLYVVNARFTTPPTPDTDYWITQVRKGP